MPTGYTNGILEGKIKTFPDFAKTCMRAFGATIHLREEPFDKKYEPRVPSDYHSKELAKAKKDLEIAKSLSDKQIISIEKKRLEKRKKEIHAQIKKIKKQRIKLDKMLGDVINWTPPTSEHTEFRRFMMQQLESTIEYDGDTEYYEEHLQKLYNRSLDAKEIRQEMIDSATEAIEYHTEKHKEELERCKESNKWVEDLMKSLKQK